MQHRVHMIAIGAQRLLFTGDIFDQLNERFVGKGAQCLGLHIGNNRRGLAVKAILEDRKFLKGLPLNHTKQLPGMGKGGTQATMALW